MVVQRKYFNQTSWRTLAVLEALSEVGEGKTLSELRDEIGCSKSSLFPILKTIEDAGFIRSDAKAARYVLSPKIYELVRRHSSQQSLTRLFDDYSRPIVESVMETMQMAVLDGKSIVYVAKQESNHPVRLVSDVGRRLPSHATALGKCLLSGLSNEEVSDRFEHTVFEVFTNKTVSTLAALLTEIERARTQGYAEDWQEVSEGLCCVAAPIIDGEGEIVAAISFSVPQHRATPDHWRRLRGSILQCASGISARLGYVRSDSDRVGVFPA